MTAMPKEYLVDPRKITAEPTHPGVLFGEDVLPELDGGRRSIGEIATLLGVTRQTLHRVIAGRTAVTPEMAVRLGKLCGNGPDLWLNMQARHDAWKATRRLGKRLDKIPTLA
jgi:addiction module HigA family antidote